MSYIIALNTDRIYSQLGGLRAANASEISTGRIEQQARDIVAGVGLHWALLDDCGNLIDIRLFDKDSEVYFAGYSLPEPAKGQFDMAAAILAKSENYLRLLGYDIRGRHRSDQQPSAQAMGDTNPPPRVVRMYQLFSVSLPETPDAWL